MLNKETLGILKQLGQINQEQIITYPRTTIILGKAIQAFLDVDKLGEEEFEEIGIYDINQLYSVVGVIEKPEITYNDRFLEIKSSTTSEKTRYGTTQVEIIESSTRGNPDLVDRIRTNTEVLSFDITTDELNKFKTMSSLLKNLSDLSIESKGDEVTLTVKSVEKSTNSYNKTFKGDVKEEISMLLVMDIIKKLPNSDYKVTVFKSKKGSLVAVWDSKDIKSKDENDKSTVLSIVTAAKAG